MFQLNCQLQGANTYITGTYSNKIDFSKYQLNAQFFYSSTIYMLKNKRIGH